MQRVRVGLTGLAFVFLLVMLATALLRMSDQPDVGGTAARPVVNVTAPAEPLAQLGVAPGNGPPGAAPGAATVKPAPVAH